MADTLTCSSNMKLANGSKGDDVTILQTMLKELGYYTNAADDGAYLKIDGDFGDYTEQAVRAFQEANPPLANDGWIGEVSCAKLNSRYLEKKGITTTTTTATQAVTTEDKKKSRLNSQTIIYRRMRAKWKEYLNHYTKPNIDLNGLQLVANTVTPNTPFRKGQWERTQLMDGTWDVYPKLDAQLKYTVEVTLLVEDYNLLYPELEVLQAYIINVKGIDVTPGDYTMSVTGVSYVKTSHIKVTMELIEVDKLV